MSFGWKVKDWMSQVFIPTSVETEKAVRVRLDQTDGIEINVNPGAENVQVANVPMATANTEYSFALSSNSSKLTIRSRQLAAIKVTFVSGQSGTTYLTIKAGAVLELGDINFTSKTVYMQSPTAGIDVEILETFN